MYVYLSLSVSLGSLQTMSCMLLWHFAIHFAIQQQSTAPQSDHALLTQVTSMCSWTPPWHCASSLVPSILHFSHGFQCSPTLNRQPYEGRLPLTSWWRKSSNMTVGQCSLISLAHHCYDWHPGSRCGWTCNQLTSKVDGGVTEVGSGGQFSPSVRPHNPATKFRPPSATVVSAEPFFTRNRDIAVPAEGNGDLQTLICVLVARPRWCLTLSNRILSPDKTEWRLISATLCGWRRCFVADHLRFTTHIREEVVCIASEVTNTDGW